MHIRRLHLRGFKRFHDLTIEIPVSPKLVVMAGPNGSGKSSLIDAARLWHGGHGSGEGWFIDDAYHRKAGEEAVQPTQMVEVQFVEEIHPTSPENSSTRAVRTGMSPTSLLPRFSAAATFSMRRARAA